MARIRTIKPEMWGDEKLSKLNPLTRLVFIGLISLADDRGRVVDNVKTLDGQLFPLTADSCAAALDLLADLERIERYTSSSGQALMQIVNWRRHQKVDRPSKYSLPGPLGRGDEDSRETSEVIAISSRESRDPTLDHRPTTSDPLSRNRRGEGLLAFAELRSQRVGAQTPQGGLRYSIPKARMEAAPEQVRLALEAIGGQHELANAEGQRESVLRGQFATAYAAAVSARPLPDRGETPK